MEQQIMIITIARTLIEVAGLALLGQGALWFLAGKGRQQNLVYQIFQIVTRPVIKTVRVITPRFILDAHIPFVAFFLLFWAWLALAYYKHHLCVANGLAC